jgi:hypothetical protein
MKRHPEGGGSAYHRGHAIPHTLMVEQTSISRRNWHQ